MESAEAAAFLREFSQGELKRLRNSLPPHPEQKFVLFLEIQRVMDVWCVENSFGRKKLAKNDFDILRWGLNLATAHLLTELKTPMGIPLMESWPQLRATATNILWNFGAIALIRRAADMLQHGFLLAKKEPDGTLSLRDAGAGPVQMMDHIQFDAWRRAEASWTKEPVSPQGWTIVDQLEDNLASPGAFWARREKQSPPLVYTQEELEKQMLELIFPWKIPQTTMMGYGATPELDDHFIYDSFTVVDAYRREAGIDVGTDFGEFTSKELLVVALTMVSLLRKHVYFGLIAHKHIPEINAADSFTIWGPKDALIESISEFAELPQPKVATILETLTVSPRDLDRLSEESTPLLPMLVDLGNGLVLKPVSSLLRNPFSGFQTIAQWRNSSTRNVMSASREAWFRAELYSIFGGSRYSCIPGNVVLRKESKRLTDIDAAIFDRTSGELGLFQLKWQDYSTNDIKALRSKTRNLASEIDGWAEAVVKWLLSKPPNEVAQALRLKLKGPQRITSIFLFAVSRSISRTHGYGFPVTSQYVSMASWHQFQRVRGQIGPAPQVISKMHEILRDEEGFALTEAVPQPMTIELPGLRVHFEDLWNAVEDPEDVHAEE